MTDNIFHLGETASFPYWTIKTISDNNLPIDVICIEDGIFVGFRSCQRH